MSPVVISHIAIVLLHAQQPPAQHLVVDVEARHQVQVQEHAETRLEGVVVVQVEIVEGEVVELEVR